MAEIILQARDTATEKINVLRLMLKYDPLHQGPITPFQIVVWKVMERNERINFRSS